ncbi:MAG: hypothetical protein JRH20_17630 [Deltaproteobacteria bacterium]|nr:hypothetical protein [Deltaproteobacteria bacterium]
MHKKPLLLTFMALLLASPAGATMMVQLDLDTLVGRADQVVVGKVRSVKSRWSKDTRKRIVTDTEIVVEQTVKGAASQVITVRTMGGVVDGIGMRVSGAVRFQAGQHVLAFTERRGGHRWMVGMRQGLFHVAAKTQGKSLVSRSVRGLSLTQRTPRGLKRASVSALDTPQPLRHFIESIQRRAKTCAQRSDRCLPPALRPQGR